MRWRQRHGAWCLNLETNLLCLRFFSLALNLSLLLALVFTYLYCLHLCFYFHCTCYSSLASLMLVCFSLSIKKTIEHFNSYLEECRGEVLEPLIGNSASLLDLSWPFTLFILIVTFSHSISIIPIHPPLGILSHLFLNVIIEAKLLLWPRLC